MIDALGGSQSNCPEQLAEYHRLSPRPVRNLAIVLRAKKTLSDLLGGCRNVIPCRRVARIG